MKYQSTETVNETRVRLLLVGDMTIRLSIFGALCFACLLASCRNQSGSVSRIADAIRRDIPLCWIVTTSNATICIQSERDVILIGRISRPALPGGIEQLAREFGHAAKYQVTLSFVPRLNSSELERLRMARQPFERVLDTGARTKSEYGNAICGYEQHRVPVFFTDEYSVFVESPNDRFIEVYPPEAAAQVQKLMASLKRLFHEY